MAHEPYPSFSPACFGDIIRIVRGGTVREELPLLAKCLYTLIGASLSATIGEPDETFAAAIDSLSVDELGECYSALQGVKEDGPGIYGAGESAIDPATLAMLIQLGMALLKAWIDRKNQGS